MSRPLLGALVLFAAASLAVACTPSVPTGAPPDAPVLLGAPDASWASATCRHLVALGCPLGADPLCPSRFELAVGSEHHTDGKSVACANAATSKVELADCGAYLAGACP